MKVFVQIIDKNTGIFQHGVIDEPIQEGFEITNALGHFGVSNVNWIVQVNGQMKYGEIDGTSKIVTVVTI